MSSVIPCSLYKKLPSFFTTRTGISQSEAFIGFPFSFSAITWHCSLSNSRGVPA